MASHLCVPQLRRRIRRSLAALAVATFAGLPIMIAPVGALAATSASPSAGSGWSVLATPDVGPFANKLNATAALSPSDVWAVGCSFDANAICHTLTEHWNGSTWSVIPSPNEAGATVATELLGVSGDSPTDVWAVGEFTFPNPIFGGPFILHWNGSAWSQVATPQGAEILHAVDAISPDDAWAVGAKEIEHWDGHKWSIVPIPGMGNLDELQLQGVTAVSPTDAWAVGGNFGSGPFILHWNGTSWSVSPSPSVGNLSSLASVSAVSVNDVWAVGLSSDFSSAKIATLAEHWNGTSWTVVPGPDVTQSALTGVVAVSSTDVWAVGSSKVNGKERQTLAEQWNGSTWTVSATPTAGFSVPEFGAVTAISPTIFAVGSFVDAKNNQRTLAESHAA